jgi:hypothetical protein
MPANTTHGYPYPVGTDRVADGDDAIKALAEAIDPRLGFGLAAGSVALPITAASTPVSVSVTFPVGRFSVAPYVVASNISNGVLQLAPPSCTGTTTSGTTVQGARTSGSSPYSVSWIALGM